MPDERNCEEQVGADGVAAARIDTIEDQELGSHGKAKNTSIDGSAVGPVENSAEHKKWNKRRRNQPTQTREKQQGSAEKPDHARGRIERQDERGAQGQIELRMQGLQPKLFRSQRHGDYRKREHENDAALQPRIPRGQ